jgi:hypothetical protein
VPGEPRVQPRLPDVGRVDGQSLGELESARRGLGRQVVDLRPRSLRVHVIRRERRHPAPVVDAGRQDQLVVVPDQVRRCLDPRGRAEHEPGHRDSRGKIGKIRVRHAAHLRVGLGPEVLHDDFLDAAVLASDLPDGEDRIGALRKGLADPDENACGEGDAAAPGVLQHPQANSGVLVRAAEVRPAALGEQPCSGRLQHHPHRRRDRLEPLKVLPGQHAGVQVGQQPGLLQHADRHRAHIRERVIVAMGVEPFARLRPARFRAIAEGEKGFLASERCAIAGDGEDLIRRQERGRQPPRHGDKRAVGAAVTTESGQRYEDLAGVGDHAGTAGRGQSGIPHAPGVAEQRPQIVAAGLKQDGRLRLIERLAVPGPRQRPAE